MRKEVYPYNDMTDFSKIKENQLPPKKAFYSKLLNDPGISDEEYDHPRRAWREFWIENMGEYHNLHLRSDVLLLADAFDEFRNVCRPGELRSRSS